MSHRITLIIFNFIISGLLSFPSFSATISMDASWFNSQGQAPYRLDQPDTVYTLTLPVTTENSAFVVLAKNITLDLNSQTVTYNQCTPSTVDNGSFENGSGSAVPGWDLAAAPSASIAFNDTYLFGNQVLRFSNINSKETIISDPITIPRTNHNYVAIITPGHQADYRTSLVIKVVDHTTNTILAYGVSSNVERGFSAVAEFRPTLDHPIHLEVEIDPFTTTTIDLDDARVVAAYDSGIIAAQQWSGDIPAMSNMDTSLVVLYNNIRSGIENFTIKNGSVVQGTGTGYRSSPLEFSGLHGLHMENISVSANGPDTTTLHAPSLALLASPTLYNAVIKDCSFNHTIDLVCNRMHGPSVIAVSGNCDILIENNAFFNAPQLGISGGNSSDFSFIIRNNTFQNNAVVVNAYAISLTGIQNFDILSNTILTTNGRGILIDGYSASATEDGRIYDNHVSVQELGNREYLNQVTARALRIRNNVDARGPHRNLHIYNNAFTATVNNGQGDGAYAARVSWSNPAHQMDNAGICIEGNTFTAISYDPSCDAKAFVMDGADPGIHATIQNNRFVSNGIGLKILDSDGGDTHDIDFISNCIQYANTGAALAFKSIDIGYWIYEAHTIRLIDTCFESGANSLLAWSGSGIKDIETGWLLHAHVTDQSDRPLEHVLVESWDSLGSKSASGTTDVSGETQLLLSTLVYRQETSDPLIISSETRNPFQLTASLAGYTTGLGTITLLKSDSFTFQLQIDPSITFSAGLPNNTIMAFPSPAREYIRFIFAKNITGQVAIRLYTPSGETAAAFSGNVDATQRILTWQTNMLAPGIYFYRILFNNGEKQNGKIAIIH